MRTRHLILSTIAPIALLAGCGANRGVESIHQPVVGRATYAFDLAAGPGGLAPGERERLAGWMASLRPTFGDTIALDDDGRAAPAARAEVRDLAAHYGLLVDDAAPVTGEALPPDVVRVVVSRSRASVPGCPDHGEYTPTNLDQHTSSNYGCAINTNLAAMVADPLDLVRGAPGGEVTDPMTGTRAIDTYRKATPTGGGGTILKQDSAGGGK